MWVRLSTREVVDHTLAAQWLVADELISGVTLLRIRAAGEWRDVPGIEDTCPIDGRPGASFPEDRLMLADAPVGALIGRFGGSTAGPPPVADDKDKAKIFAIGSYCVLPLPQGAIGPLFVGINVRDRPVTITRLSMTIDGANPA